MSVVTTMMCWVIATAEWRTVAFYHNGKGYGVVRDYATSEDFSDSIIFVEAEGEKICVIKN